MKETAMSNLSLKILSVLAAILIWLVVVNVDDPIRTETYAGIRVSMVNAEAITSKGKVYRIEDNSDVISVQVSAKRSIHKKLSNTDFVATADMEKDIQYDNLVAINVTCNNKNVKSTDIKQSRSNVKVSIENSATEEFNVVVKQKGTTGAGYIVGDMTPERRVIAVTGPESMIDNIRRLEAEIDVTGSVTGDTVVSKLKVVDGNGDYVDTSYLSYFGKEDGITVKYTMLSIKEVELKLGVSGTPGVGYRYMGLSFKPETIVIAGNPADLKELSAIRIPDEALDITGIRQNTDFEVSILDYLPENIRLVDEVAEGLVAVTVSVEGEQTRQVEVPVSNISLSGVPKGYSVTFGDLETIQIPVTALNSELDALDFDDIAVKLDVSSAEEKGTYTLPLEIHIPGDYKVNSVVEIRFELLKGSSGLGNTETEAEPPTENESDPETGDADGTTDSDKDQDTDNSESGNTSTGEASGAESDKESTEGGNASTEA